MEGAGSGSAGRAGFHWAWEGACLGMSSHLLLPPRSNYLGGSRLREEQRRGTLGGNRDGPSVPSPLYGILQEWRPCQWTCV